MTISVLSACAAFAADPVKPVAASEKTGINKDAMTMRECRGRLAMPKAERPRGDDPAIDKDAICVNMLGSDAETHRRLVKHPTHAKAASAA